MAEIQEQLTLIDNFTAQFTQFISLAQRSAQAAEDIRDALVNVQSTAAPAAQGVADLSNRFDTMQTRVEIVRKSTSEFNSALKRLVGTIASVQTVKWLVSTADQMTSITARLDMMNDGLQTTEELQEMIYQSAMRFRGAYADTAAFVAKLGTLAGDAFSSNAELVAFAEQVNKQMVLSGTSAAEASGAMLQLTQALASGALRGDELNSVMEQTPMIVQTIAEYMGVTTGEIRELAAEGKITADVVKNAMLSAAAETNAKFDQMPMTWGQVWTQMQNIALLALQPLLDGISFLANHMEQLSPLLAGVAAAALAYAAALGIQTVATWVATGAAQAFFITLLTNPLTYIVLLVGLVVAAIYKWVQSVGGLEIAWMIVVDNVLFGWDTLKAGFFTGVYLVMDLLDEFNFKFAAVGVSIQNFMGDMKVGVLTILQNMVNGAIDIINWFIDKLNLIPGVEIEAIKHTTFGAAAAMENEAEKAQRDAAMTAYRKELDDRIAGRAQELADMWSERDANHAARQAEIAQRQAEAQAGGDDGLNEWMEQSPVYNELDGIGKDVGSIKRSVSMADEDIRSLVDMAERRYVNNINLTAQTPVINISGQNSGDSAADRRALADAIRDILVEQVASGSVRTTARVF